MEETVRYLIKVDSNSNNNKFYKMIPHGSTWTAEYGRVGARGITKEYRISTFYSKYQEKIQKGYIDQTNLHQDTIQILNEFLGGYKEIEEDTVRDLVIRLRKYANEKIKTSYTVSSKEVTEEMVNEAQKIIDSLYQINDNTVFNNVLITLFSVIPRKMKDVKENLAASTKDFSSIIQREQDLLDVMSSQISTEARKSLSKNGGAVMTVLEAMGLEISPCSDKEVSEIMSHLTSESDYMFKRAWKVVNKKTEYNFRAYCQKHNIKNTKFLYHGSRNENYWHILCEGLRLNPKAVTNGKMFGHGIYFAPKARKSIRYSSLKQQYSYTNGTSSTGFLAVFKVAVGKSMNVERWYSAMTSYTEGTMRQHNCDSLYAHAGVDLINDEIIVYNENAATIRYLIELN